MIKYSVVIPAYNASDTLRDCLDALIKQSIPKEEYEIIVVDDGSTDDTDKISREYPVKYIKQANHGPASARNRGAKEAQGDKLLFTDSDCIPDFNWLEEMTQPFQDSTVSAVKGSYKTKQRSLTARFAQIEFEERYELLKRVTHIDMVDTYSAAFQKAVFFQAGGFDQSFPVANNEDTDLSYKLSAMGLKMVFAPEAVVYHLRHPASPDRYFKQKFWRGYWRTVVYQRFPQKAVKDTYTPQTLKIQILLIFALLGILFFSVIWPKGIYLAFFLALSFVFSAAPFVVFAFRRDRPVGILSPFFLAWRSLSIGLGVLYSVIKKKFI